jgi:hypothetical protein
LKIFFSTLFDKTTYPQNIFLQDGVAIGSRHVGPIGLTSFLELHLGLPNSCTGDIERIFNYRKNLHQKAKGSFFEKSLATNDLEVASKLLQWRDELKTSGWDFKTGSSTPSRLQNISKVEKEQFIGDGNSERFSKILEALQSKPALPIEEIIVHEPKDLLQSHLTKLFSLLVATGIKITYRDVPLQKSAETDLDNLRSFVFNKNSSILKKSDCKGDGSLQILRFSDILSAGKGIVAYIAAEPAFQPVVLNEAADTTLSLLLRENGQPSTGQEMRSASHPDLQLLALIPVWLWKPYNPHQVLDFFLSPLNIFSTGLSKRWMKLFSENPGIRFDDWITEIGEFAKKYNREDDKEKYTERLKFILNIGKDQKEKLGIETVIDYYNFFYQPFLKRRAVTKDEVMKERLDRLCNAFAQFIDVLKLAPEKELNLFDLQKLLQLVLQPVSILPFKKQANSIHEISYAGLIVNDCDDLLWMGFNQNSTSGTLWNEWTSEELNWLSDKGIFLETSGQKAKREFWYLTQWLRFVKKRLILVIPAVVNGEPAQPHPFHSFLQAAFNNLHAITITVEEPSEMNLLNLQSKITTETKINPIPSLPIYWNLKPGSIKLRGHESFNSLEKLLKFPYRWVMEYPADLQRGKTLALPPRMMFYGTLSHGIFQELLRMPGIMKMNESETKKIYTRVTNEHIEQRGLLLHTQGEEGTLQIFREYLFEKFWILLKHLKENDWEVEGCEVETQGKIGNELIEGRCDLLLRRLRNKKVEKAIVDLKYSGKVKYRKLMENQEDLQLAIYSKIFHDTAGYCPTSYFIISEGSLFTTCADAFRNGFILRPEDDYKDTYTSVLQKIETTIQFRRQELKEGRIEVGEQVSTDELDIYNKREDSYIIPKKKNDIKCSSDYNDYETFIDTE